MSLSDKLLLETRRTKQNAASPGALRSDLRTNPKSRERTLLARSTFYTPSGGVTEEVDAQSTVTPKPEGSKNGSVDELKLDKRPEVTARGSELTPGDREPTYV